MQAYVTKIRPDDAGYDEVAAKVWPWLVFPTRERRRGTAFPTHRQALYYAANGKRLRLTPQERLNLRSRPEYQLWAAQLRERRHGRSSA